jgi:curved DNA-binding protein CbpA
MSSNSASCFYTILGVNPSASEDIIRKAYKKRALEWHPDKNLNNPGAEHLFKILQKAYETLSNEKSKQKYDKKCNGDDSENVPNTDLLKLSVGNCLSNMYKDKIDKWIEEYPFIKFVDNYEEELGSIILSTLNNYEADIEHPIEQCFICHKFVHNKRQHMQTKCNDYLSYLETRARDFDTELSKLSPKGWNWQPIEQAPSIYRQVWESLEWGNFKSIVEKMTSVHKMFASTDSTDRMFYETLQKIHSHTEQIAANLASSKAFISLPDVINLKKLIDSENGTRLLPDQNRVIARSGKNQEYREFGKICIVPDNNHPVLKHIFYDVSQQVSSYTIDTKDSRCSNCQMKIHFFNRKDYCRMCCKLTCRKCLLWQTCRHIGYVIPVVICKLCTKKKMTAVINVILNHVQQQIELERYEYLAEYLALLRAYGFNDNDFYESIARRLLSNRQFTLALQHADHIHQSENDWLLLAETMVRMDAYNEAATCFHIISRQFERRAQYWISLGDTYRRRKVNSSTDFDPTKLAILAYRQAGLSYDGILRKAASESDTNIRRLLIRYVAHTNKQASCEWKRDGESRLTKIYRRSIGICCLHLSQLSTAEWTSILQTLIDASEYGSVAALLRTLSSKTIEDIIINASPVVRFFCEQSKKIELPMIDRLKPIIESENIKNILVIAALIHLQNEDYVWNTLKEQYLSEPKQYDKALICHKMQVELNLTASLDWIDQGILENNSITFDLKDSTQCNWLKIGYKHLKMTNYETALNCYCRALRESSVDRTETFEHILSRVPDLPESVALWYAIVVYKMARDIFSVICNSVQHIIKIVDVTHHSNYQFTISAVHHLNKTEQSMPSALVGMNLHLLTGFLTSPKEFIGGLHFLDTASNSNSQFAILQQQYDDYVYVRDYEKVQQAMKVSIVELAMCLKQVTSVNALQNFIDDYCGNSLINQFPTLTQAMLYLIHATIAKLQSKYDKFVQKLEKVLACSSHDDVSLALAILIKDSLLLKMGFQSILSELANLPNADLTKATCLVMPIVSPPKIFKYESRRKPSRFVTLVHHYEKAIVKNMSMDRFGSAMAYVDLCMAVSDRTCITSNWILACLYLYEDLSKMTSCSENQPRAYAYRNLINELATNAFFVAREYLAPHMQMYIYKLALLLIIHTNRLFSQLIKSSTNPECNTKIEFTFSSRENVITNQVLKNIINYAKLVPIMQLRALLSYDTIFAELLGFDFLQVYFKTMAQENNNNHVHFYHYYLLEGVWDRWIVDEDFELTRQQSMKSLLANKNWKVSDIERLLNHPLIPRTPDGWLCSERKPLGLSGRKRYAKVDGVKFNFNTGEVKFLFIPTQYSGPAALFDSEDIIDVFTKGITNAIITLDQPDQEFLSHPFQEMKYFPASLANTKYLTTLLHTDYLLKFMTTGMEINSKWPFPMRRTSEGFINRLPKRLQDLLKPLQIRDKLFSRGHIHRFWIEAGNPTYEWVVNEKTNEIIYRISDVPMYVKQHLMKYDDEGKLIDDKRFDDKPDYSREAQFVKAFTDNYNEIGEYFPEFLRLKELAKLGILLNFMRHRYDSLKENIAEDVDVKQICESLCEDRRDLEYPSNSYYNVKHSYEECLRESNVSTYDVTYTEENDFKTEISSFFEKHDDRIVENMAKNVCEFCCSTQKYHVQRLIDRWIRQSSEINPILWFCKNDASVELVSFIRKAITDHKRSLMNAIENLNISLEVDHSSNLSE